MNLSSTFKIFPEALQVCKILKKEGFEAYYVGGAVRDALLNRPIHDIDITTNAKPEQIESLFEHTIPTGKAFGTITVRIQNETQHWQQYEVTTYRSESGYKDQRKPDTITFESHISADLSRRDFTINAMAYDPIEDRLEDPFFGQKDLENKTLETVGNPFERFKEDSLRLFRAFRFMGQLGFTLSIESQRAISAISKTCTLPAKERIHSEMHQLLTNPNPGAAIQLMQETGLLMRLIPLYTPNFEHHWSHLNTLNTIQRWAGFLHPFHLENPTDCKQWIKKWPFSRQAHHEITALLDHHLDEKKAFFKVKDIALSGKALQDIGFKGIEIGQIQKKLKDAILNQGIPNTPSALISFVRSSL